MAGLKLLVIDEYGSKRTLSNNVHVGPEQPTDSDTQFWVDTNTNPATLRYLKDGAYAKYGPSGSTDVTTLGELPTNVKLVTATITGDSQLSVAGDMIPGQELRVIISGTGNVTLPSDNIEYINLSNESILPVDGYAEINIISDGVYKYIRAIQ